MCHLRKAGGNNVVNNCKIKSIPARLMNTKPSIFFLFACIWLFLIACKSDAPSPSNGSHQGTTTNAPPPSTLVPSSSVDEGQNVVYQFWKYEDTLAPLKGDSKLSATEKDKLIEEFKSKSSDYLLPFDSFYRRSLLYHRNKILECAPLKGFDYGYCVGQMMFFMNPVLGDFALDAEAAKQFNNQKFTERIFNQTKFMKSLLVPKNAKPLPKDATLVYGELCLFSVAIFNAPPPFFDNKPAQFARVALLAVDASQVKDKQERIALSDLRRTLIEWSQGFGGSNWEVRRTMCAMYLIQGLGRLKSVTENSFQGTKYEEVGAVVKLMRQLAGN